MYPAGAAARSCGVSNQPLPVFRDLFRIVSYEKKANSLFFRIGPPTLPPRIARADRLEHVPQEKSAALIETLRTDAAGFLKSQGTIKSSSTLDGMRFEFTNGDVIHYRPSGNAPELRCYTEAATAERAGELLTWGLKAAEAIVR